jgi:predicted protein tyrosine phosphatase
LGDQQHPVRILFICSQNKWRSPTAEAVFAQVEGVEALSAGTNHNAETPLSADLVEWADMVVCMERVHQRKLQRDFAGALRDKQVTVLGIKDDYRFMDAELVERIKVKFPRWFDGPE